MTLNVTEPPAIARSATDLLNRIFEQCMQNSVSDIQMRTDRVVYVERSNGLERLEEFGVIDAKTLTKILYLFLSKKERESHGLSDEDEGSIDDYCHEQFKIFQEQRVADFSCEGIEYLEGKVSGRLRIQAHLSASGLGITCRILSDGIPKLDDLGMEVDVVSALKKSIQKRAGLCLVTGPTGSGKSTTLAALIDWCRQNFSKHIVTIEDPIEYSYPSDMLDESSGLRVPAPAMVTQQEVGRDIESFRQGLKDVLRKAPHIILLGEIRDRVAMETCMEAAQTGHLVLSTLHTTGAVKTLGRILELYPQELHSSVLSRLSEVLVFIQSQGLLKSKNKRVLTYEFLNNDNHPTSSAVMHYDKGANALEDAIMRTGNIRWDSKLESLLREGKITQDTFENARLSKEHS